MKNNIVVAVLATFCLTAALFLIIPTRSNGLGQYDPWADLNSDGTVDILDAIMLANAFGTSGTPINRTETLTDLQLRLDRIEQFFNQTATVEFLYTYGNQYMFGIARSWNASKLLSDPIADRLNASLSGMRNVSIEYTEYTSQVFFVEPQLSQFKGYGQLVRFWYDRVTPPDGPLTLDEIETVRETIEEYLAKP